MKTLQFSHKDVYIKVHAPLLVTYYHAEKKQEQLVYASILDIDSRVQAIFAQLQFQRSDKNTTFWASHAPAIGEKVYDKSKIAIRSGGNYKHLSQREDDTFVSGIIAHEHVLNRVDNSLFLLAWDGFIQEKLCWALDQYYDTPILAAWIPYIFDLLLKNKHLEPLNVYDGTGDFPEMVGYHLNITGEELDTLVSEGIQSGEIQLKEELQEQGEQA